MPTMPSPAWCMYCTSIPYIRGFLFSALLAYFSFCSLVLTTIDTENMNMVYLRRGSTELSRRVRLACKPTYTRTHLCAPSAVNTRTRYSSILLRRSSSIYRLFVAALCIQFFVHLSSVPGTTYTRISCIYYRGTQYFVS